MPPLPAEFERSIFVHLTKARPAAVRASGRTGGLRVEATSAKKRQAQRLYTEQTSAPEIAERLSLSRATSYRHLADRFSFLAGSAVEPLSIHLLMWPGYRRIEDTIRVGLRWGAVWRH
jgi:hypothetical protein